MPEAIETMRLGGADGVAAGEGKAVDVDRALAKCHGSLRCKGDTEYALFHIEIEPLLSLEEGEA